MIYRLSREALPAQLPEGAPDGRFVLHKHSDRHGPHYDLRLETGPFLLGYRVADQPGDDPFADVWATAKAPHPKRWLDDPGPARLEDEGPYRWLQCHEGGGQLLLEGRKGPQLLQVRAVALDQAAIRAFLDLAQRADLRQDQIPALLEDGRDARARAVARLCGLGRELDGTAFNEAVWRKALHDLSLREIHQQLEAFETRFDARHPPAPVSRPECLDPANPAEAQAAARIQAILRGENLASD